MQLRNHWKYFFLVSFQSSNLSTIHPGNKDILIPFATQLKLDENQVREQENLRVKLQQEQELLSAYQSKQTMQLRAQHEREEKDLQDKVSVRRALLEEKVPRLLMRSVSIEYIHPTNPPYQLVMRVAFIMSEIQVLKSVFCQWR